MKNKSIVKNIMELVNTDIGFVHGGKSTCSCSGPKKDVTKVVHSFKKDAAKYLDRNKKKLHKKMPW